MKILLGLFLIIIRIITTFKILIWLVNEYNYPELYSIANIELYLVFLLFDIWISMSINSFESQNKDNNN